jgi:V/A-type H+-transporting ATPase subunit I
VTLRVRPARWFEAVVPRPTVARSVEALAASGVVQLEKDPTALADLPDYSALRGPLDAWRALRQRYLGYWPPPRFEPTRGDRLMEKRLGTAMAALQQWVDAAAPHVQHLEGLRHDRHELHRLAEFLHLVLDRRDLDLAAVANARPPLAGTLLAIAAQAQPPALSDQVLHVLAQGGGFRFLMLLGPAAEIKEIEQALGGREARSVPLPPWLPAEPAEALAQATGRIAAIDAAIEKDFATLAELGAAHRLPELLGELRRIEWLAGQLEGIPVSEYLARITGWTSAEATAELAGRLRALGIPGVVNFLAAPGKLHAPTLPHNPRWARPFEMFVNLVGTPGRDEADPTPLVAVVAPVLFGYMFGDVGQGLLLLLAGLALRRRWPALGMLIPGGLMAIVFGLLFGSAFCREDLLPPLWVAPLHEPLAVLGAPLAFGAVLIIGGLVLAGVEERWAGRGRTWFETDAGLIALYLGLLGALVAPAPGLAVALAGALWYVAGPALVPRKLRRESIGAHAGELFERVLQLAVNTLSFVRVGAFAIAHAGLAAAVTSMALAAGGLGGVLVLVIGNALILALEGLVVAIQTTRLILFEFFVRFVRGEGRPFRALVPPSAT